MTEAWKRSSEAEFGSAFGRFRFVAVETPSGREHGALVAGDLSLPGPLLVRVQSACVTGTALGALLCDCRQQIELALTAIGNAEAGLFLYLDQEGRGHGLVEKVAHFAEINSGADTWEAAVNRGVEPDRRDYEDAAAIIRMLAGDRALRVMTNNPEKLDGLSATGLEVAERVPLETDPTPTNRAYLQAKKRRMGHLLERV